MNFFVILLAGALALFGAALKEGSSILQIVVGASFFVVTFSFKSLDARTSTLIKDAEIALDALEKRMAIHLEMDEIKLIELASRKRGNLSYRQSFNILFGLGYVFSVFSVINGIFHFGD
jgi:hypothetical protein